MSDIRVMKDTIAKYTALLPVNGSLTTQEAERRAGEFLVIMAIITEWKHMFTTEKIKYTSVQTVVFAEEVFKGDAKTITENKLKAEASKVHVTARENLERIENDISYLKTVYEVMNNGHLYYRQMSKETL
jgi:microsomal dipeptidase-like Zn-dependent dipeptidase